MKYAQELDEAKGFGEVFEVARRAVRNILGEYRAGLSLFLAEMPPHIGAYHEVGTNVIVMNRMLVTMVAERAQTRRQTNAFIFAILLHEYLHALGHLDEGEVRALAYRLSREALGEDHEATTMAAHGPLTLFPDIMWSRPPPHIEGFEVIKDFDRTNQSYLV
ncbi:MAG: hypothetical protein QXK39_05520 [Nitrososphaerota archaeon]